MAFQMQQVANTRVPAGRATARKALLPPFINSRSQLVRPAAIPVVQALTMTETQTLVHALASTDFHSFLHSHAGQLTVVDFFTPWCGPCKVMAPVLEQWSTEYDPNQVTFAKVDCSLDAGNRKLAIQLGVKALPTFLLYKGEQMVGITSGSGALKLKKMIEQHK